MGRHDTLLELCWDTVAFLSLSAREQVRCFGICLGFGITNSLGAACGEHWGSPSEVPGELQPRGRAGGRAAASAAARCRRSVPLPGPSPQPRPLDRPPAARDTWEPAPGGATAARRRPPLRRQYSNYCPVAANQRGGGGVSRPAVPTASFIEWELGGRRGAGSHREAEVLGIPGGTGSTEHGRLHACQRPWGSQHYPDRRAKELWGVMICPSSSGVPGAPATSGSPWAVVGSDVGLFCAASLTGECLGSCQVFCVNKSSKHAPVRGRMLQGWHLVQLTILKISAWTNKNYSFVFGIDAWPWLF